MFKVYIAITLEEHIGVESTHLTKKLKEDLSLLKETTTQKRHSK